MLLAAFQTTLGPAKPILPHSRLQNPQKTLPTELVHITTSSLSLNLEVPLALQNP
jgi:hypothetical protein